MIAAAGSNVRCIPAQDVHPGVINGRNSVLVWPDASDMTRFLSRVGRRDSWVGEHYAAVVGENATGTVRAALEGGRVRLRFDSRVFFAEKGARVFHEAYGDPSDNSEVTFFLSFCTRDILKKRTGRLYPNLR